MRLGDCRYGAWSGGRGAVVTACGGAEPQTGYLVSDATDLVFRVNRGQILLNDRVQWRGVGPRLRLAGPHRRLGRVPPRPGRAGRQRPGAGGPGRGATGSRPRPSRTTSAPVPAGSPCCTRWTTTPRPPAGSWRSARSAGCPAPGPSPSAPTARPSRSRCRPTRSARPPSTTSSTTAARTSPTTPSVTVRTRDVPVNGEPALRTGYRPRDWVVASGGTLDVPVLPDWRDPRDGDPLALVSATAVGGVRSGAVRPDDRRRPDPAHRPGRRRRRDGGVRRQRRHRRAGHRGARLPGPGPERHAVVRGRRRARHRLGGDRQADHHPTARQRPARHRPADPRGHARARGQDRRRRWRRRADRPGRGDDHVPLRARRAPTSSTTTRRTAARPSPRAGSGSTSASRPGPPRDPVAMPDQVTLFGQALDDGRRARQRRRPRRRDARGPAGATPRTANQLDVAVVQGRWVRVSARQGTLTPNPQIVRYTDQQRHRLGRRGRDHRHPAGPREDNTPVTQVDRVTVRAGAGDHRARARQRLQPRRATCSGWSATCRERCPAAPVTATDGTRCAGRRRRGVRRRPPGALRRAADRRRRRRPPGPLPGQPTRPARPPPGRVEITVVPAERRNQPPEPPPLEGRAVAGDTVKLRLPGVGVDPDGDAVTLLGHRLRAPARPGRPVRRQLAGVPGLPRQRRHRRVRVPRRRRLRRAGHRHGAGGGRARRAAAAAAGRRRHRHRRARPHGHRRRPGQRPDRRAATGSRSSWPATPPGVRLRVRDRAARHRRARPGPTGAPWRSSTGSATASTPRRPPLTAAHRQAFNNPPVVLRRLRHRGGRATPSPSTCSRRPTTPTAPPRTSGHRRLRAGGRPAGRGGRRPDHGGARRPADGRPLPGRGRRRRRRHGVALRARARATTCPFVRDGARRSSSTRATPRARGSPTTSSTPPAGPVTFTLKDRVRRLARRRRSRSVATGSNALTVRRRRGTPAPVRVRRRGHHRQPVGGRAGQVRCSPIPVQVGETKPILRCPDEPIEVPQGESARDRRCPRTATSGPPTRPTPAGLSFDADVGRAGRRAERPGRGRRRRGDRRRRRPPGRPRRPGGDRRRQRARAAPLRGHRRTAAVAVADPDLRHEGRARAAILDLAPYLRPGVGDPVPTVLEARQLTDLDVDIDDRLREPRSGSPRAPSVAGTAEFQVVMSDVARADAGPDRQVEGRISLDVLDVPDAPTRPGARRTRSVSRQVSLTWREPDANGAPIDYYEVRASGGPTRRCAATACEIGGLTNGRAYTFQVRAHNAVGFSDWSGSSRPATPDDEARAGRPDPQHPGGRPDAGDRLEPAGDHDVDDRLLRRRPTAGPAARPRDPRRRSPGSTTTSSTPSRCTP